VSDFSTKYGVKHTSRLFKRMGICIVFGSALSQGLIQKPHRTFLSPSSSSTPSPCSLVVVPGLLLSAYCPTTLSHHSESTKPHPLILHPTNRAIQGPQGLHYEWKPLFMHDCVISRVLSANFKDDRYLASYQQRSDTSHTCFSQPNKTGLVINTIIIQPVERVETAESCLGGNFRQGWKIFVARIRTVHTLLYVPCSTCTGVQDCMAPRPILTTEPVPFRNTRESDGLPGYQI
jgi:hypothetical protein